MLGGSWDFAVTDLSMFWGETGLWNFGLEKLLSIQMLMSCYGNLENDNERNESFLGKFEEEFLKDCHGHLLF